MMAVFDGEEFGRTIVEAVNASIERSIAPLLKRLDALEALPTPRNGRDGPTTDAVRMMIIEECKDVRAGLEETIGPEMQIALATMVEEAVKAIPVPQDGKDAEPVNMDAIRLMVTEAVEANETVQVIEVIADKAVAKYVDLIPTPVVPELPDIDALVKSAVEALPPAKDGKDAEPVDLDALADRVRSGIVLPELPDIAGMIKSAVEAIPLPVAPELPDIVGMVDEAVTDRMKTATDYVTGLVEDTVKALPPARDGKDADPVDMDSIMKRVDDAVSESLMRVDEAVRSIPVPKDGKDADPVDMDAVAALVQKAVDNLPVPKDGKDGADMVHALIGKDEHLHITLSNGKTIDVGQVVGDDGVDCDIDAVQKQIAADIKALFDAQPKPRDGFGFDDMSVEYDGERTITLAFQRGEHRKEFPIVMPVILDRGVYVEGKNYDRGDCVTWAGSRWIAQADSVTVKPDEHKGEWLLSVKRGQRGKDGVVTTPRPKVPVQLGAS